MPRQLCAAVEVDTSLSSRFGARSAVPSAESARRHRCRTPAAGTTCSSSFTAALTRSPPLRVRFVVAHPLVVAFSAGELACVPSSSCSQRVVTPLPLRPPRAPSHPRLARTPRPSCAREPLHHRPTDRCRFTYSRRRRRLSPRHSSTGPFPRFSTSRVRPTPSSLRTIWHLCTLAAAASKVHTTTTVHLWQMWQIASNRIGHLRPGSDALVRFLSCSCLVLLCPCVQARRSVS